MKATNSWGSVADWYDTNLKQKDTYQSKVILPNLLRLLKVTKNQNLLDLGCGQGFFAKFYEHSCKVVGVDISSSLIEMAKKSCKNTKLYVSKAENIDFISQSSFDKVLIVLALQNIKGYKETIAQIARVLKQGGSCYIVINHPYYRQPKHSQWYWDNENRTQNRLVNKYMSSYESTFIMNPGNRDKEKEIKTLSYHHSLQTLTNEFGKNNMAIVNIEEWISHKTQDQGDKTEALEEAKREIPLFMYLEVRKF
jgi:ubiquinone/menaquinone biosynthesis C-methylase UbiE